ncbi:MAG TPA: hypothetical protein VJ955_06110, partial [Desulfuromonadales bacterium]|nr:hypothetical protein [Desulfuromonadales bacterium]
MTLNRRYLVLLLLLPVLGACTPYKSREVPFKPPGAFANMQSVDGAQVAAQAYADPATAKNAFGFDIRAAGLLPVQVVIDNRGTQGLTIVPGQTFLIDAKGNY